MTKMLAYKVKPSNESINDEIVEQLQTIGLVCEREGNGTPYAYIGGNKMYFKTFYGYGVCSIYVITPEMFNALYNSNKTG